MTAFHFLTYLRTALLATAALTGSVVTSLGQDAAAPPENIHLPDTDDNWKKVKDYVEAEPVPQYVHASPAAMEAFRDMKYGIRIHWGIYSILGEPHESWPFLQMSDAQKQSYNQLYKTWNPTGFNADDWMQLFQDSGMKMFAFTAKHHEGFSMFDTKTRVKERVDWAAPGGPALEACDFAYSIMDTPFHRDVVKELCDAAHQRGIKIDLYFSHPDWYDADFRPYGFSPITTPGATAHPELYGHSAVASRAGSVFMTAPDPTPDEEARMLKREQDQLTELLTNYGKIDMVCLDIQLGKKVWPQTRQMMLDLRKLDPDVMFRARGIGNYGDYYTPEDFVPSGKENTDMPWFVIYPLAKSFSYDAAAKDYKGGRWIVKNLVDSVAKGGNFMVGVGPDANGNFHPQAIEDLKAAGAWLKINGEGIYATRARNGDLWHEGADLRFTRSKDNRTVYAFALKNPGAELAIHSVRPKTGSDIILLGHTKPLPWTYSDSAGLVIDFPADLPSDPKDPAAFAYGLKIEL